MPKTTAQQFEAIKAIGRLLNEAAVRLGALKHSLGGGTGLPDQVVSELCYLELRMLCEVVALCCLAAHGDIEGTRTAKLQKEFAADNIMRKLESLQIFILDPLLSVRRRLGSISTTSSLLQFPRMN